MTAEQQQLFFERFVDAMRKTMLKKGNDYSMQTDRLSNFKTAGAVCQISPEQNCLSLIATKVSRLATLFASGKKPDNESIDDSIMDLANYAVLLGMIVDDTKVKTLP